MTIARHVVVSGRVQGVGYRNWVRSRADALGLSGWVRNLRTGDVEAVFAGPAEVVDGMVEACRGGPIAARVDGIAIDVEEDPPSGPFEVRPTA